METSCGEPEPGRALVSFAELFDNSREAAASTAAFPDKDDCPLARKAAVRERTANSAVAAIGLPRSWVPRIAPPAGRSRCGISGCVQAGLGDFHIFLPMPARHSDAADQLLLNSDREAAAEDHQPRMVDDSVEQRWVLLDEVKPFVGRNIKADGGPGL